jgi:hypothetical protein
LILYTPLSLEEIFRGIENLQPPQEITVDGVTMEVEMLGDSQARIVRLISPDPNLYLDQKYAPGSIVQFTPSF